MSYNHNGGYNPASSSAGYNPSAPFGLGRPPPPRPPSGLPPFPPVRGGYGAPPLRPTLAPGMPPPTLQPASASSYRSPYDEYNPAASGSPLMSTPSYDGGRKYDDVYDPYQPSNVAAYDPSAPSGISSRLPTPAASYASPPASFLPPKNRGDTSDLPILTGTKLVTVGDFTTSVYDLPPSELPITKYITFNPDDAITLHRAICQDGKSESLWYSEGSNRAGEGWAAAVEWILDDGMSRSKMRGFVGHTDSLGTELGAMIKAVEGFREQLQQCIRNQKPINQEFILFTSSPCAIISLDTSSRPESVKFFQLWRDICLEFLEAHLTIVWLPRSNAVDGWVLAEKIATVAATNSYTKRKKERSLEDIYNRPGGGDPLPGSSTVAGPWQRGDADPSYRKTPFERPKPLSPREPSPSPSPPPQPAVVEPLPAPPVAMPAASSEPDPLSEQLVEPEDEGIRPRADALCVTNFPDNASAKDLGILFAQFGEIVSVDIFSIPPVQPRFAFVAFAEPKESNAEAVQALHRKPIKLDTPFALQNADDLAIWRKWPGTLMVVESTSDQLIPSSIARDFPDLPSYATQTLPQRSDSARKRNRDVQESTSSTSVPLDSPSSKRARSEVEETNAVVPQNGSSVATGSGTSHGVKPGPTTLRAQIDLVKNVFIKHGKEKWIAHTCLIATDLDQVRRQLQSDLYATDEAEITRRELEGTLTSRGFTVQRIDAFVIKTLKVLDGIASADELEGGASSKPPGDDEEDTSALEAELADLLKPYPVQTQDAMAAAATVLEYLNRGKTEQEKVRLDLERRVGVLDGMVKIGEQVSSVVKYLLNG